VDDLGEDNPLPTEPLPQPHSARNFVFELEVACHFMAKGLKARTATEPDVILENSHRLVMANLTVKNHALTFLCQKP
jgi:hypothetical protein